MDIMDLWQAKEAIMAYPEASSILFFGGLGIGWGASFAFVHQEIKVSRILIDELRRPDISDAARKALLASAPPRELRPWTKSLGVFLVAAAVGLGITWFALPKGRHLTASQMRNLTASLKPLASQTHAIEINSVPNCDECEVYAQQFREFFTNLPGWKAGGGVITFWDSSAPRNGLQLVLSDKAPGTLDDYLTKAFRAAGISLIPRPPETLQGLDAIIVVAREF